MQSPHFFMVDVMSDDTGSLQRLQFRTLAACLKARLVDAGDVAGLGAKTRNVDVLQINQPNVLRLFKQTPEQVWSQSQKMFNSVWSIQSRE